MGKNKYIETPEALYELFEAYRSLVKSIPKEKLVEGNKGFVISLEKLEKPLTHSGFRVFCQKKGFTITDYFSNKDGRYSEYATICNLIKDEIREDQITGGMLGQYNSSITQRLNGLADKQETSIKVEQPLFGEDK